MTPAQLRGGEPEINVGDFLTSPRHGYHFRNHRSTQQKIAKRRAELHSTGGIDGKTPIINIQQNPSFVELHDGNASVVAWWLYMQDKNQETTFAHLLLSLPQSIVLRNRVHPEGETWHPFVPIDLGCAAKLRQLLDPEQGRTTCQALTLSGEPVYFNNTDYFSSMDASESVADIGRALLLV